MLGLPYPTERRLEQALDLQVNDLEVREREPGQLGLATEDAANWKYPAVGKRLQLVEIVWRRKMKCPACFTKSKSFNVWKAFLAL